MSTTPGLVLTGGASTRMGSPKATLTWRGERLADRAARILETVCDPVLEVGPGYSLLRAVREHPPGAGPLAALEAGLRALDPHGEGPRATMLLAVDLPFVEVPLIELLVDWPGDGTVVPLADGHPQVLCARYGAEVAARIPGLVATGARSLRALVDVVEVTRLHDAEWRRVAPVHAFADVDTPGDLLRWQETQ